MVNTVEQSLLTFPSQILIVAAVQVFLDDTRGWQSGLQPFWRSKSTHPA